MARTRLPAGLADSLWMRYCEVEQRSQRFIPQMRLISQNESPMSQRLVPPSACGSALNRTEHTPVRFRIGNTIRHGKIEPIQFGADGAVARSVNHHNLLGAQL